MRFLRTLLLLFSIAVSDVVTVLVNVAEEEVHVFAELGMEGESESESEKETESENESQIHHSEDLQFLSHITYVLGQVTSKNAHQHTKPHRKIPSPPPDLG